ncbi:hypothetical protein BDZ94DRAFT_1244554, partial [Collybia nuda]
MRCAGFAFSRGFFPKFQDHYSLRHQSHNHPARFQNLRRWLRWYFSQTVLKYC